MPRRMIVFALLAVALAAIFVRLGFWQLERHRERVAFNGQRALPLSLPAVPFDSAMVAYRHVTVDGTPDYAREFVLSGRSRSGTPGVHVFTPLRRAGRDTAVLVNRGWVYAADAATAELAPFREPLSGAAGYVDTIPAGVAVQDITRPRTLRRLTTEGVGRLIPYPVARLYVVMQDSSSASTPARLPQPQLGNGPHLGYAVQWFSFALIGLVGTGVVLSRARARERERERGGPTAATVYQ